MQVKKREAERIFHKLEIVKKESKHHISGWIVIDGARVLPVHYSFGNGDMPGFVGKKFMKSFLLKDDEFSRLKGCTMSKDEYFQVLLKRL